MDEYLSDLTEEEFGSGNEIPTTDFLVYGLLTLWIYTVLKYHSFLKDHIKKRLSYFSDKIESVQDISDENRKLLDAIIDKGFRIKSSPKFIALTLYFTCFLFLIVEIVAQQLLVRNLIGFGFFDKFTLIGSGVSVLLFCSSTIFFLSWVRRTIQSHEYHELLIVKFLENPEGFKILRPSSKFMLRWQKNKNIIVFFLVLAFPMVLSPFIAVKHIYSIIDAGGDFQQAILFWSIIIFILGAVFHLWGTKLLFTMFNGHLRIETVNQSGTFNPRLVSSAPSDYVLSEKAESNPSGKPGNFIPERVLAAIMLTDMVGFSKEMEASEDGTYSKLLKHNEIIREEIAKNRGKEIKTIGDAFLVKFFSAVDAVKTAIAVQRRLSVYNNEIENEIDKIHIRIGIHIGDILIMGEDIIGNGVNIAARIEPLADPGGICISADVYNMIKKSIDVQVINLGQQELKNIKDSPDIYKVLVEAFM